MAICQLKILEVIDVSVSEDLYNILLQLVRSCNCVTAAYCISPRFYRNNFLPYFLLAIK